MSIFFDQYYNTGVGDTPFGFGGEELGFFDAMGAAYEAQVRGSNIDTYTDLMSEELQPLIDAISERQGLTFSNPGRFLALLIPEVTVTGRGRRPWKAVHTFG